MKFKKKLNDKTIEEIDSLKSSRGSMYDFSMNLIQNISLRYRFINIIRKEYINNKDDENKEILEIAAGLYLSSLITCWETFFRDICVFVCEIDSTIKTKIYKMFTINNINLTDLQEKNINVGEFMSKQWNLQNLQEACTGLNFLLDQNKNNIIEFMIEAIEAPTIFSSSNHILFWFQQSKRDAEKNMSSILDKAFSLRHQITHDANFKFKINAKFMSEAEDCFIIIAQILTIMLSRKYNQEMCMFDTQNKTIRLTKTPTDNELPYIFSKQDFLATYLLAE